MRFTRRGAHRSTAPAPRRRFGFTSRPRPAGKTTPRAYGCGFESRLLDPDDDTTYLELRLRKLKIRDKFSALLPLDVARRLRDQLTEHLDAAETTGDDIR
jgi:hypothetical protein